MRYAILPVITLALPVIAYIARLTRGSLLEVLQSPHIRTARAKGLSESRILWRHAFKPTILPVVSFLGPATAALLTGSLIVEPICGLPGVGLLRQGAVNRDYTLVMGMVVFYAVLIVLLNLLVDLTTAGRSRFDMSETAARGGLAWQRRPVVGSGGGEAIVLPSSPRRCCGSSWLPCWVWVSPRHGRRRLVSRRSRSAVANGRGSGPTPTAATCSSGLGRHRVSLWLLTKCCEPRDWHVAWGRPPATWAAASTNG
jgi:hypothetical protein